MQQIHLRIPDATLDMINKIVDGKNITDKVRSYICSNYLSRDFLEMELEKSKSKVKFIEQALKRNPFHNMNVLSKQEQSFFTETIGMMDSKGPEFIYARKELYNNIFKKNTPLIDFKLLLYEYKAQLEKEGK